MGLAEVRIPALPPARFQALLGERYQEVEAAIERGQAMLANRVIWHINSTARGGGVAELLQTLLAYARGSGVDARWGVISANPDFFRITKRIHNRLHGFPGDGGELGEAERSVYEDTLAPNAEALTRLVRPGDVAILHDPQTAGLADAVRGKGAKVVFRCHVGVDHPNELTRSAWDFLRPYIKDADGYVFSRREFAWEGLPELRIWIIAPSIDAFSAKNQELSAAVVGAILGQTGLADGDGGSARFVREDGTPGRVDRKTEVDQEQPLPLGARLVTQVSRWDRLKDPGGVLACFAEHIDDDDVHLLLAGPSVAAVTDDPEGGEVLAELRDSAQELDPVVRRRVHLASLPMDDLEENAAIVNAIQRRSTVVMQKSIAEGFGLTVAEAMWKSRPVLASRLGGIQDQIVDGESGELLDDPSDLDGAGTKLRALLGDPALAGRLGEAARLRVEERFLGTRHLIQYLELVASLLGDY